MLQEGYVEPRENELASGIEGKMFELSAWA